nr:phosphopentomutase [Lachnospiraceae bacterium]
GDYGRLCELSQGKDTTTGHWEMAGIVSENPMPTYPNGFPKEVIEEFEKQTGRKAICNLPYSGTAVIEKYGQEHMDTGALIVYTSADSVFQIAAHEDIVPVEQLYEYCRIARKILQGEHGVGRVIARPFVTNVNKEKNADGEVPTFLRTPRRHDFSLEPTDTTMMDVLKEKGYDVLSVGKIIDIFAERGITDFVRCEGNPDGIEKTIGWMERDFHGLMFVNLVDTDMIYGHRRDIDGYAKALSYFDEKLPEILNCMGEEDVLFITADHGCDPGFKGTDHTREDVPLLIYGKNVTSGKNFGTIHGFDCIADTVLALFNEKSLHGKELY